MSDPSPFHPGEQQMQTLAGVRARMDARGARAIRDEMPDQHRAFFADLSFLPLAMNDARGWPAATILRGAPGFVTTPDAGRMHLAVPAAAFAPPGAVARLGASVGILGIMLAVRRRNRMNGIIRRLDSDGVSVAVVQSFGNCDQYISRRAPPAGAAPDDAAPVETLAALDGPARDWVGRADTMFVASAAGPHAEAGVDISHRGGPAGFLRLDGDRLAVPDYRGNLYFNTLGNFLLNPRAAVLVPDFSTGAVLHLAGPVVLRQDPGGFPGAERHWELRVEAAWRRAGALPGGWAMAEA